MANERIPSTNDSRRSRPDSNSPTSSSSSPNADLFADPQSHASTGSSAQCPTIEVLDHLLSGEVVDHSLTEHIARCRDCQRELDRLSDVTPLNELRRQFDSSHFVATWLEPTGEADALGTLAGFRIEQQIGAGGMGVVYCGRDERLGRQVAVKVLKRIDHPQAADRFLRETRAAAKLLHDHVVPVYASGLARDGRPYLVMPLIEGETLAQRLRREPLIPRDAASIVYQIAQALAAAHGAGLVHRDVKPANIMLDRADGRAKLTDFGLVRALDDATLTQADVLTGTPEYMSPEQAAGLAEIDARSDIYSLGVSLYECLTGTVPYRGRPLEILDQHRFGVPLPPFSLNRSVGDSLNTICLKCLAREPQWRYQTATELAEDLQRFLNGMPILAKPTPPWMRLLLWARRKPAVASSLVIVIATLLIGSIVSTMLWLQSASNARQAQNFAAELSNNQQQLQAALEVSESQRARAQRRFDDLRQLSNALLFEIYPQVEYLENSLAAREAIITSALQYLDDLFLESGDDIELQAELATAYEKIGELVGALSNTNLGDKQSGLQNYFKARQLRETVYDFDPLNPENIERLANNYYVVARTLWAGDQIPESTAAFDTSIQLQRKLIQIEPDSESAVNKLATILIDSANIPSWDGQFDRAKEIYLEAQQLLEELLDRSPENPEYKKTITRMLRAVSRVHSGTGDLNAGEAALLKAIDIGEELIEIYPDDFSVARSVWISRFLLGELYVKNKQIDKAVEACQAAIDFPKGVMEKEPTNAFVAIDLANAYFNLARSYRNQDNFQSALPQVKQAVEVMQGLVDAYPDDREYQRNLAIYFSEIAFNQIELSEYPFALSHAHQAVELLLPLSKSESAAVYGFYDLAFAYRLLAKAQFNLGDAGSARNSIDEAIRLLQLLRETGSQQVSEELVGELEAERAQYQNQ